MVPPGTVNPHSAWRESVLVLSERLKARPRAVDGHACAVDDPDRTTELEQERRELGPKVLVIEDTPVHLLLIERALNKRGVRRVFSASSGAEAMSLLHRARDEAAFRPDLILLDLQLPGVSGFHILVTIRATASLHAIPVVVLSCADSQTDVDRCVAAGADAFVSKAEDYNTFRETVFEIVDWWRSLGEAV
jgi:CheY-like chemotaxis protein